MTSINAIRFSATAGAMVSDEQRHWNPERMKSKTCEKIRSVVSDALTEQAGLVAAYGNTGASTIGEEIRETIRRDVDARHQAALEAGETVTDGFLSMFDLAALAWSTITALKHRHVDEQLAGRYGFRTADFCRGAYEREGKVVEIRDKGVVRSADEMITWKGRAKTTRPVFGNSGVLAGFAPDDGFQIFHYSMAHGFWRPVGAFYLALGSGSDAADFAFLDRGRELTMDERRGAIDPVEGLLLALSAVNGARRNNLGVDGYFKVLLFDGAKKKRSQRLVEIHDHRAKLLMEVAAAEERGVVPRKSALELVDGLAFGGLTFEKGLAALWKKTKNRKRLDRFLRGYST